MVTARRQNADLRADRESCMELAPRRLSVRTDGMGSQSLEAAQSPSRECRSQQAAFRAEHEMRRLAVEAADGSRSYSDRRSPTPALKQTTKHASRGSPAFVRKE